MSQILGKIPWSVVVKFQTFSFGRGSNFEFAIDPKKKIAS